MPRPNTQSQTTLRCGIIPPVVLKEPPKDAAKVFCERHRIWNFTKTAGQIPTGGRWHHARTTADFDGRWHSRTTLCVKELNKGVGADYIPPNRGTGFDGFMGGGCKKSNINHSKCITPSTHPCMIGHSRPMAGPAGDGLNSESIFYHVNHPLPCLFFHVNYQPSWT